LGAAAGPDQVSALAATVDAQSPSRGTSSLSSGFLNGTDMPSHPDGLGGVVEKGHPDAKAQGTIAGQDRP
jgi:hypothetical protein